MLPVGIFPNGQDEDRASGFLPSYTVLACPPMKKQGEFSISNLLLCLPYLTIPFGRVNNHTRQSRRFFHSGACRTRSDATVITEICKRGTFCFTLDLMLANNLETGQPIQVSWWIFIWPGVHSVPCLVLCQQRAPPHVDSIEEGHMVGNTSPQSM